MSSRTTAGFWLGVVQGVNVDVQDYVAGRVASGRVRVRGGIIDQPQGFVICFVGALGLGCSNGTEGDEHGDVNGNHIIEESPDNLLNKADGIWRKRRGVVDIFRVLEFGAIDGFIQAWESSCRSLGCVCWNLCSASLM